MTYTIVTTPVEIITHGPADKVQALTGYLSSQFNQFLGGAFEQVSQATPVLGGVALKIINDGVEFFRQENPLTHVENFVASRLKALKTGDYKKIFSAISEADIQFDIVERKSGGITVVASIEPVTP